MAGRFEITWWMYVKEGRKERVEEAVPGEFDVHLAVSSSGDHPDVSVSPNSPVSMKLAYAAANVPPSNQPLATRPHIMRPSNDKRSPAATYHLPLSPPLPPSSPVRSISTRTSPLECFNAGGIVVWTVTRVSIPGAGSSLVKFGCDDRRAPIFWRVTLGLRLMGAEWADKER